MGKYKNLDIEIENIKSEVKKNTVSIGAQTAINVAKIKFHENLFIEKTLTEKQLKFYIDFLKLKTIGSKLISIELLLHYLKNELGYHCVKKKIIGLDGITEEKDIYIITKKLS